MMPLSECFVVNFDSDLTLSPQARHIERGSLLSSFWTFHGQSNMGKNWWGSVFDFTEPHIQHMAFSDGLFAYDMSFVSQCSVLHFAQSVLDIRVIVCSFCSVCRCCFCWCRGFSGECPICFNEVYCLRFQFNNVYISKS